MLLLLVISCHIFVLMLHMQFTRAKVDIWRKLCPGACECCDMFMSL